MLFPGDWVEILGARDILSTLDAHQALEHLPFMPEMLPHCGQVFRVQLRAERTCVRALPPGESAPVRRLSDCVVLEGLRCDGAAHGGCQLGCMMFWKEQWLRKVDGPRAVAQQPSLVAGIDLLATRKANPQVYFCQGTELGKASRMGDSNWHPRTYFRLVRAGTFSGLEVTGMVGRVAIRKLGLKIRALLSSGSQGAGPVEESLGLEAGDWVEVRSMKEILRSLDARWCHKGLSFNAEMYGFCGLRTQVADRIQTILAEETGLIRPVRNTVSLVGTGCPKYLGCARQMPLLWREAWLKRIEAPRDLARTLE